MKSFIFLLTTTLLFSFTVWNTNFEEAKKIAQQKHQLIILNFSGSDWCLPCIRLRKEIFESNEFKNYADSNLVLVNADFPRLKKNKLSKPQVKQNEELADKYNPKGLFPYTLILNADGKVLKTYDGYPNISTAEFIKQIKTIAHANN
jgi:thioredoxin-related protein